jgi:lipid-A-disaccharide synthase
VSRLRIGVLAGEPSGDILGASVLAALHRHVDDLVIEGIGGPMMQAQGLASLFPMERLSVMGFVEPLRRLPELLRIRRQVLQHFSNDPPDIFLGIDSPDFTIPLERKLRRAGITTAHLVSPSVWAWRRGRIRGIRRAVDLMLCLFPFETDIYRQHGVAVRFVGHPLADEIPAQVDRKQQRQILGLAGDGPLVALLPGSRESEVRLLAPLFLLAAQRLQETSPDIQFLIPAANAQRLDELRKILADYPDAPVSLLSGRAREVLGAVDAALIASGTATLEAALLQCPMVVAYRMPALSWWLMSRLARTPFAALPNILAGEALVPELLQHDAEPGALASALQSLLLSGEASHRQLQGLAHIHRDLQCNFAETAADALVALAKANSEVSSGRSV